MNTLKTLSTLNLGNLSFYWRMTEQPNSPPNVVPDFLPFEFSFLDDIQLIIQKRNPQILQCLETIYKEDYNVGYLQQGHYLIEGYGNDFMSFIENSVSQFNPKIKKVTEIGAGGCYVLKRLKEKGFEVSAIDPSPIASQKGKEFGFDVIKDFYPASEKISKSDMIIHYDVLEHIDNPVSFINAHKNDLNENGLIIFAVPDCSPYIDFGDISIILHEHLNYFDAQSLKLTVEEAGFECINIEKSKYGGVLYCAAKVDMKPIKDTNKLKRDNSKFTSFVNKHQELIRNIDLYLQDVLKNNNTVGFYVPLRATPYLSILKRFNNIRFFDDDPGLHKKYFDGFKIPIENMNDLKNNPVSNIIITSFIFGEKIADRIKLNIPSQIEIKSLQDFK
jgi:2-polyprenyl-3-methyl-5-hydroxy-6-metoxy-1,4-benzoquinol methylase